MGTFNFKGKCPIIWKWYLKKRQLFNGINSDITCLI